MATSRRTTLCYEGWAYLAVLAAVLAGAVIREINLLFMVAGLMAGPALFSWRLAVATMRGLAVRRRLPRAVCAGDMLVVELELENSRRRGAWAVVAEEQIRPEAEPAAPPVRPRLYYSFVPGGRSQVRAYRGRLNRRGAYRLGPVRLWTRFPFGLVRRTVEAGATDRLVVFPRLGRLTRRWVNRRHEAFEGSQRRERRYGRTQGDFYGVRPWRRGDSRRWVHWRASARHGTLVVRQFEQYRNRDVAVLADLWQPRDPGPQHLDNVELAVSFAATIVTDLCRKGGSNVMLAVTGPAPLRVSGPASALVLQNAMEGLALAEAHPDDRLPQLLAAALDEVEPGTEIVLLTTRPVDVLDPQRFAAVWADPARRAAARRLRCFDTSDPSLADYFQTD